MPQTVSSSRPPSLRMLKSMTPWLPGHAPVEVAVQPGGVSVGKTPIMGRWAPRSSSLPRWGMWPPSTML